MSETRAIRGTSVANTQPSRARKEADTREDARCMTMPSAFLVSVLIPLFLTTSVFAQTQTPPAPARPSTGNAPPKPGAKPDASRKDLQARVIEVKGVVEYAPSDAAPLDVKAWKPVKANMTLGADTQIRTSLRSRCVLMFGEAPDQTVISLRRATLANISEYYRTPKEQRVRLGLGYGAIRGGSSEGTLRSDVVIDSTVATLAKRGTEGFEIEVEPVTGQFRISLARSGLVEATAKAAARRKHVRAGEYVTQANIARMWVNQSNFDRAVRFFETEAVTRADLRFMVRQTTGISNFGPHVSDAGFPVLQRPRRALLDGLRGFADRNDLRTLLLQRDTIRRPEGDFGFGRTFRVLTPRHITRHASR